LTGSRVSRFGADEAGSAVVEFVLVGTLLTVLTLSVLQLGLDLHIRNTLLDAAAEGARFGALAGSGPQDGVDRTRDIITTAVGESYARNIVASTGNYDGHPTIVITVSSPLPLLGLIGIDGGLEVAGHAADETVG
jgi:Flp pilus assembly protein TadG